MNRSPNYTLLSTAIDGFNNYKSAEGLSQRTLTGYARSLRMWLEFRGDAPLKKISTNDILNYLNWLRTEYIPIRFNGQTHPLSPKSLRNVWVALKAFYRWVNLEFQLPNLMQNIPGPRFKETPVEALTREEVEKMIKACLYSREANTHFRRSFSMRRATGKRDQLIIMILLDTGLRASEFCHLTIGDIDLTTGQVMVKHGVLGGAKGSKGRTVYLGKATRRDLWHYLNSRDDGKDPRAPLICNREDRPFNPTSLRKLITRIGQRAGVKRVYPHKFRHTFAITYLRSGGDVFTLQALLGHSSLDMVRHYSQIAEVDIENAHRKASPVDNWRL